MKKNNSLLGLVLVVLAQIMVAINIVTSMSLLTTIPSLTVLTVRFSLAALILFLLHLWSPNSKHSLTSYFSLLDWYYGCERVEGMLASLSTAIMPVSTIILAWLFLGEHFTLIQCLGVGIIISSVLAYLRT